MSVREAQKNTRRRAILDAARSLILEGKERDFSMLTLAEKAGVSLVTLAVSWVLAHQAITAPIIGASRDRKSVV